MPFSDTFPKDLVREAGYDPELREVMSRLDEKEAFRRGYWQITKHLADSFADAHRNNRETIMISGHSQGGTRAQLMSMYLRKSRGWSVETVSVSGTGAKCMASLVMNDDANYLDDVEPDIEHPQITDYAHVFDPWANVLGEDVGGWQCNYGSTGLLESRAYKYCERIFGLAGPTLIVADGGVLIPGGADDSSSLDFRRCRLFTHIIETVVTDLERPGVILDNGDTDIGCVNQFERANLPTCPVGTLDEDVVALGIGAVVGITIVVCLGAFLIYQGIKRLCCNTNGRNYNKVVLPEAANGAAIVPGQPA
jgi:hypothetical protein